jgi:hypothetical protein
MQYGEPNLNEGKDWSEMDLTDLKNALAFGRSLEDIADFLCRSEQEVREKIAELGWAHYPKPDYQLLGEWSAATHWQIGIGSPETGAEN